MRLEISAPRFGRLGGKFQTVRRGRRQQPQPPRTLGRWGPPRVGLRDSKSLLARPNMPEGELLEPFDEPNITVRCGLERAAPRSGSLNEKRQSFTGGRSGKLQAPRIARSHTRLTPGTPVKRRTRVMQAARCVWVAHCHPGLLTVSDGRASRFV
jgi:hypothetical protein